MICEYKIKVFCQKSASPESQKILPKNVTLAYFILISLVSFSRKRYSMCNGMPSSKYEKQIKVLPKG